MKPDYMKLPELIEREIAGANAVVHVGYPWWLRLWLARGVIGITLGRHIYLSGRITKKSEEYLIRLVRHELTHIRQVQRHGLIVFLWKYVTEFLRHLWRLRSFWPAYHAISFEVEAAAAEHAPIIGPAV